VVLAGRSLSVVTHIVVLLYAMIPLLEQLNSDDTQKRLSEEGLGDLYYNSKVAAAALTASVAGIAHFFVVQPTASSNAADTLPLETAKEWHERWGLHLFGAYVVDIPVPIKPFGLEVQAASKTVTFQEQTGGHLLTMLTEFLKKHKELHTWVAAQKVYAYLLPKAYLVADLLLEQNKNLAISHKKRPHPDSLAADTIESAYRGLLNIKAGDLRRTVEAGRFILRRNVYLRRCWQELAEEYNRNPGGWHINELFEKADLLTALKGERQPRPCHLVPIVSDSI
jgi:hypothetical protein